MYASGSAQTIRQITKNLPGSEALDQESHNNGLWFTQNLQDIVVYDGTTAAGSAIQMLMLGSPLIHQNSFESFAILSTSYHLVLTSQPGC